MAAPYGNAIPRSLVGHNRRPLDLMAKNDNRLRAAKLKQLPFNRFRDRNDKRSVGLIECGRWIEPAWLGVMNDRDDSRFHLRQRLNVRSPQQVSEDRWRRR